MIQSNAQERAELEEERQTTTQVLKGLVSEAEQSQRNLTTLVAAATTETDKQSQRVGEL